MKSVKNDRAVDSIFADSLYFASGAFSRAVEKLAAECWKPSGLSPSQGNLLLHLIDNYRAFPCFISADLHVHPSSVTRLADHLEAKGLINRISHHGVTYLDATDDAIRLLPVLADCSNSFYQRCTTLLGENAPDALIHTLNEATDKLNIQKTS